MNPPNLIDINQFQQKLLEKQKELNEALLSVREQDPTRMPGWDSENTQDDDAAERENRDRFEALEKSTLLALENVERAFKKIEQGTYGVCDACAKPIDRARLEMIPEAAYCISCQHNVE